MSRTLEAIRERIRAKQGLAPLEEPAKKIKKVRKAVSVPVEAESVELPEEIAVEEPDEGPLE
jgi:pyridoxal biosynthesis lyase PdxS